MEDDDDYHSVEGGFLFPAAMPIACYSIVP